MSSQDSRRFDAKKMEGNTLECFSYLLGIKDDLRSKEKIDLEKRSRRNKLVQIDEERNSKIYLGESQVRCPFCDTKFSMTDKKQYSVPLEQLIYLPNQEKFINDYCAGLT